MYPIRFDDVTKQWPESERPALDHLTLDIEAGEIFSLVGPSGCGKSTALRILGGLDEPSSGRVHLGHHDITDVPANQRHFGLVTQENQLLNHLTAAKNIAFPLEVQGRQMAVRIPEQVRAEAENFGVADLLDRNPRTLSEGQRRIVQLARAVISAPSTLLMDEPLGYLEDQVRFKLRSEIVRLHHDRRLTTLIVTASQHDAMAMSSRIGVIFDGTIDQVGDVRDVYDFPATARVAAFFGEPGMNIIRAQVHVEGGDRWLDVLGQRIRMWTPLLDPYHGRCVLVGIRPEDIELGASVEHAIAGRVGSVETLGRETYVDADTPSGATVTCTVAGPPPRIGTLLDLGLRAERLHLFDPATDMAILHPPVP